MRERLFFFSADEVIDMSPLQGSEFNSSTYYPLLRRGYRYVAPSGLNSLDILEFQGSVLNT